MQLNKIVGGGRAISPQEWGHSGWSLLHRLSFCFKNAQEATAFYRTLEEILPCPKCRRNMREHSRILPFPKKASQFPEWVWKLHNRVNESLGSTHTPVTFAEVRNMYINHCNTAKDCEAPFLLAIAETHPGAAKITPEYEEALRMFIQMYMDKSEKHEQLPDNIRSRKEFRTWIQKITKSKINFRQCS